MRILIVRHAEPDYVHDCLTEKGRREADLLGQRLAAIPAKAYYVSPLGRAQETAAYTLKRVNRQAVTLPWLAEFRGRVPVPGTDRGRIPWDYRTAQWAGREQLMDRENWQQDALVRGGTVADIWQETKDGVDALLMEHGYRRDGCVYRCENNTDDTLVLFCHYGIGMAVLSWLTNMPPVPMWQNFLFLTSSVTTVITQERIKGEIEFRCLCAGDVSHLLAAGEPLSLAGLFPETYNGVESTAPALWPGQPWPQAIR
ncbi:MAG: histidine phosphatase family protein [Clostridia bacterium]|nr:histidine phosphatase family protein [Clostridia bacterium]